MNSHEGTSGASRLKAGNIIVYLCLAGLMVGGLLVVAYPDALLSRVGHLDGDFSDRRVLAQAYGIGLFASGSGLLIEIAARRPGQVFEIALYAVFATMFVMFTMQLQQWWIDDAGITFSYSRSLVEGAGLTFQPGRSPTEGYSSSLWMVLLALANVVGYSIPLAAKTLGIAFGVATILVVFRLVWLQTKSVASLVIAATSISVAPFVVWSASGQEHAVQAFLMTLVIFAVASTERWRGAVSVLLALLVLTRPEAPLIVVAVFVAATLQDWTDTGTPGLLRNAGLALLPFGAFLALLAWRLWYFGDPLPNPYYAKASNSSFLGLLNPLGGGWTYVLSGLRDAGLVVLFPLAVLIARRTDRSLATILAAVLAGQLVFVVWAKGDWMGQYRFLMPVVPLIAIAAALGLARLPRSVLRTSIAAVLSVFFLTTTFSEIDRFLASPTTPLSQVSKIGHEFAELARRLEIESPLLAHHDAGAIAYERMIDLVDLGGLVDREIAKNMTDRKFLQAYVVEQRQPDFVFGARNFAARSGFADGPGFARTYVPLEFEDRSYMDADLSFVRREVVHAAPGIAIERDRFGEILRVIVRSGP